MKVSSSRQPVGPKRPLRRRTKLWVGLLILLGWTSLIFALGAGFDRLIRPTLYSLSGANSTGAALRAMARAPSNYFGSFVDPERVETLHLDLRFKHLTKIHEKRDEALELGLLFTGGDDLVPAEIRHDGRTYRAKVRLKGDLPDHLEGDKWSFRIHIRDGEALFGMRRFSIQAPVTRGYQAEPLFLQTLRDEGVLVPRYFFVRATLNGRDMGLMAVEEHFSKELLEAQQRKEGVIFKFSEDAIWRNLLLTGSFGPFDNYRLAPIDVFRGNKIAESPVLAANMADGWSLLRGFVEGRLSASEAFDEELLGRFLAVCELWRSNHAPRWHNLRFYYNPYDRELEPVAFDGNLQTHYMGNGLVVGEEPIALAMLEDPAVMRVFIDTLHRLAESVMDGSLQEKLDPLERRFLSILHREFPARGPIDYAPLRERAPQLHETYPDALVGFDAVHGPASEYAEPVSASVERVNGAEVLELRNNMPAEVEVQSIRLGGDDASDRTGTADGSLPGFPRKLPPTPPGAQPDATRVKLTPAESPALIQGSAVIEGQSRAHALAARPAFAAADSGLIPEPDVGDVLEQHRFLRHDDGTSSLVGVPGTHIVEAPLILPSGYGLRLAPGTTLRFAPDAVLVVRGPVAMDGTDERPVILEPAGENWPGMIVLNSKDRSRLTDVTVRGTRGFELGSWVLTGGVNFVQSDVDLERCRLEEVVGEDALNIVQSHFVLRDVLMRDTRSDAFDSDFSRGEIHGGVYEMIGGDAIDFSGSDVTVHGTIFRDVRDKAISVGEGGKLEANGVQIERCGTGAVSKDRSVTVVRDSRLDRITHVAFMAYIKKPEYGPASLEISGTTIENSVVEALAQTGSRVVVDGVQIEDEELDVDALYKEGYMKK